MFLCRRFMAFKPYPVPWKRCVPCGILLCMSIFVSFSHKWVKETQICYAFMKTGQVFMNQSTLYSMSPIMFDRTEEFQNGRNSLIN